MKDKPTWVRKSPKKPRPLTAERIARARKSQEDYDNKQGKYRRKK